MKSEEQIQAKIAELRREMEAERQRQNNPAAFSLDIQIMTLEWVLDG
jgi:ribosome-interacting GTPase 1